MKKWIILSPDGYTISPNGIELENFQVLGIVKAENTENAVERLSIEYPDVKKGDYDEIWVYQLSNENPYVINIKED